MWVPRLMAVCTWRSKVWRSCTKAAAASLFSGSSGFGSCSAPSANRYGEGLVSL